MIAIRRFAIGTLCAGATLSQGLPRRSDPAGGRQVDPSPACSEATPVEPKIERYAAMLADLQEEITGRLPSIDARRRDAFLAAYAAEGAVDPDPAAYATLVRAEQVTLRAAAPLLEDLETFLGSDTLDAKLIRGAILATATPRVLADFAAGGPEQEALLERFLGDDQLMREMLVAGGAKAGNYPRALQILAAIRQASARAVDGILARLALGTALEHAVPVEGETRIDPVQRYLGYEQAYLGGELDPAFAGMTVWECRFITNDPFSDAEIAWVRAMLRNYRPDAMLEPDDHWRYVSIVKTDVAYKTPEWGAVPGSRAAQLINGGGKCGPRAWFGRVALRAFGIPTWGVRQKGHAALTHWTPGGWMTNFGAAWQFNWWEDRGGPDFLLETQARAQPRAFARSLRADWIGDVLGEPAVDGRRAGTGGLWHALALNERRAIAMGEPESSVAARTVENGVRTSLENLRAAQSGADDRAVSIDANGVITVPAVACSKPRTGTRKIVFSKSFAGGMQMHVNRLGDPEDFEYRFEVPRAGRYALTARVVTVNKDQHLLIAANDAPTPVELALPYTAGMWQETTASEFDLVAGDNRLRMSVKAPNCGVSIRDFRLTPVR